MLTANEIYAVLCFVIYGMVVIVALMAIFPRVPWGHEAHMYLELALLFFGCAVWFALKKLWGVVPEPMYFGIEAHWCQAGLFVLGSAVFVGLFFFRKRAEKKS